MALVVKDRVRETTTTLGTGTVTLGGAVAGFQAFSVIGNGNTTYYTISDPATGAWEVGIGTYTSSGTTLSRDTVLESSNSNNLVNFGAGTKDVFVTYPADRSVTSDVSTTFTAAQTFRAANAVRSEAAATQDAVVVAGRAGGTNSYAVTLTPTTLTASRTFTFPDADGTALYSGGPLGTPSSGTVTNLTGTASININGTVGATTPTTGAFTTLSASGVATFSAGTAAAPAITTTGDTNTGEFFPAADTIAWTTNGAEKMRLDTNGNLTIGGTAAYSSFASLELTKATGSRLAFFADSASATGINSLTANATGFRTLDLTATDFNFKNGTSTFVTINSSGNVGIGTSSPGALFEVYKTSNPELRVNDGTVNFQLYAGTGTSSAVMGTVGAHALLMRTNATERLRISSDGKISINTANVGTGWVQVYSSDGLAVCPTVDNSSNGLGVCILGNGISTTTTGSAKLYMSGLNTAHSGNLALRAGSVVDTTLNMFNTAGTQTVYLSGGSNNYINSGNVGIGTSSPGAKLQVTSSDDTYVLIKSDGAGDYSLSLGSGGTPLIARGSGSPLAFGTVTNGTAITSWSEQMRIDSSGNVGIGVSPSVKFQTQLTTSGEVHRFNTTLSGGAEFVYGTMRTPGVTAFTAGADASVGWGGTLSNHPYVIKTNDVERLRIDSSGNVIVNTAAIATTATDGFLYVPTCAGTPTGTPTTYTGRAPIVVDTTNNKLYFYSGGQWRDAGP